MKTYWSLTLLCAILVAVSVSAAQTPEQIEAQVEKAKPLPEEEVATPIRGARGGQILMAPNPDGETWDVIVRYYDTYWGPHTMYIVDTGTGAVSTHREPHCLFGWGSLGPGGKYYGHLLGTSEGKTLMCYDPATNKVTHAATHLPAAGGEVHPVCTGTDGMVYGGGSGEDNKAAAYMYNPDTGEVTDYGVMGPSHSPQPCWGYSIGADDEYIYMASGKVPWYLVAKNKKTGEDAVLLTCDDPRGYIGVSQGRLGCTAMVKDTRKPKNERAVYYWLYQGKATLKPVRSGVTTKTETPPWPINVEPEPLFPRPERPELWKGRAIPEADGTGEIWYRMPEDKKLGKGIPEGKTPEDMGWRIVKFQVPTFPAPILRVTALADGRIIGSGASYIGNFIFKPETGRADYQGRLPLSHYCTSVKDGLVYMSGYPSSSLFVWDPDKPWTVEVSNEPGVNPLRPDHKDSNPRRVAYLSHAGSGAHKMWTACNGGDGKVYFGGRWYRNGEQGGLGWWDPNEPDEKNAAGGVSDPFGNYQIMRVRPVSEGDRYIAISTKTCRDQSRNIPAPAEAKIMVWDTQKGAIVNSFVPVPGADQTGHIAPARGNTILGITYDPADRNWTKPPGPIPKGMSERKAKTYALFDKSSILYKADVLTGEVLWTKRIPYPVGFRTNENFANQDGFDFRVGPDGWVWTWTGARFTPVNPKKSWHYEYMNCRIEEDADAPDGFRLKDKSVCLARINPQDGEVRIVGKVTRTGAMAFTGRDLYLTGGGKYLVHENMYLRRIKDVVPE